MLQYISKFVNYLPTWSYTEMVKKDRIEPNYRTERISKKWKNKLHALMPRSQQNKKKTKFIRKIELNAYIA